MSLRRNTTKPPSLEVLEQHLIKGAHTVKSSADRDGRATITFKHRIGRDPVEYTYSEVPMRRAAELGQTAINMLMRHPQGKQVDVGSGNYIFVQTSEGIAML